MPAAALRLRGPTPLGLPIKDLLGLLHDRKIRYVTVDGIAHVPEDALQEYRRQAAS